MTMGHHCLLAPPWEDQKVSYHWPSLDITFPDPLEEPEPRAGGQELAITFIKKTKGFFSASELLHFAFAGLQ